MSEDLEDTGSRLSAIASLAKDDAAPDNDLLLLYVEAEAGMNAPALYADMGDFLLWKDMSADLSSMVMDLWYSAPEDKRWVAFSTIIRATTFETDFYFPDSALAGEELEDRNRTVLQKHFGDKPVRYPPPDWE
jgi:hypothetical protein